MITEIGIVAGEIWHFLDDKKECLIDELVAGIGRDRDIIQMSLGWLAREGHIVLEKKDDTYKITLRF